MIGAGFRADTAGCGSPFDLPIVQALVRRCRGCCGRASHLMRVTCHSQAHSAAGGDSARRCPASPMTRNDGGHRVGAAGGAQTPVGSKPAGECRRPCRAWRTGGPLQLAVRRRSTVRGPVLSEVARASSARSAGWSRARAVRGARRGCPSVRAMAFCRPARCVSGGMTSRRRGPDGRLSRAR